MFYQEEEIVDDDDFRIFTYINDKVPQAIHIREKTPPRIKICTPRLLISEVSKKYPVLTFHFLFFILFIALNWSLFYQLPLNFSTEH